MNTVEIIGTVGSLVTIAGAILAAIKLRSRHFLWKIVLMPAIRFDKPVVVSRLSWVDVDNAIERLSLDAKAFGPDLILFVNRGGSAIGGMLAKRLESTNVDQILVKVDDRKQQLKPSFTADPHGMKKILVIDDVIRSGRHMNAVKESILKRIPDAEVRRVALLDIRESKKGLEANMGHTPKLEFAAFHTYDTRVLLPWDYLEERS